MKVKNCLRRLLGYLTTSKEIVEGKEEMASNKKKRKERKKSQMKKKQAPQKVHNITTNDNYWESELDVVEECSKCPESIQVFIKPLVKAKIDALMEKYTSQEWLAYLVGENNVVEDIVIPKQEASATTVKNIEFSNEQGLPIIGVIHSHHNMGHDFSGTDNNYINQNHDISLCVSHSGVGGQVRWKTPCGALKIVEANIRLMMDTVLDKPGFLKEAEEFIKKPQPPVISNIVTNGVHGSPGAFAERCGVGEDNKKVVVITIGQPEPGKVREVVEYDRFNNRSFSWETVREVRYEDSVETDEDIWGESNEDFESWLNDESDEDENLSDNLWEKDVLTDDEKKKLENELIEAGISQEH
jgi:proteasome lid subunit RPN8/RPN11